MNAVYRIINKTNGRFYIGSSSRFEARKRAHLNMLRRGVHHNKPIQEDYDKYGESCFDFEILKKCAEDTTRDDLFKEEQKFISASDDELLYNLYDNAHGMSYKGEKNPMFGKTHSDEIRRKLSEINSGEHNPWYGNTEHMNKMRSKITKRFDGRKHTEETKEKMSKAHKGREKTEETRRKLSLNNGNNSGIVIDNVFYRSMSEASRQLNISRTTITSRVNNPRFKNYYRCSEGVETN
ncbi:GIY-YIG family homing endonuclease [Bacillus phage BSP15]|nr:GIY-YIG family homing endonuclease [Bacillus phage BSP15]